MRRCHAPYKKLKLALAGLGVTYKDVADLLGLSETSIGLKINGQSDFFVSEQIAICSNFQIPVEIFFDDVVA